MPADIWGCPGVAVASSSAEADGVSGMTGIGASYDWLTPGGRKRVRGKQRNSCAHFAYSYSTTWTTAVSPSRNVGARLPPARCSESRQSFVGRRSQPLVTNVGFAAHPFGWKRILLMNTKNQHVIPFVFSTFALAACGAGGSPPLEDATEDVGTTTQAGYARNFGMHCSEEFEREGTIGDAWETCGNFGNKLDDQATKQFYFDLWNKQYYWHDTGDQAVNSLESVDLFFSWTHGGILSGDDAIYTMYEANVYAHTKQMRLGDESRGLSIFSSGACHTMKFDDGAFWGRLHLPFSGGLRMLTGSHGDIWIGLNAPAATQYASLLNQNTTIVTSWFNAFGGTAHANDLTVAANGNSADDCINRLNNMTWGNFSSYPRRRDNEGRTLCFYHWTDA
jgi:hypothetical protein